MRKRYRSIILVYHNAKYYIRLCTEIVTYTDTQYWVNFANSNHTSVLVLNHYMLKLMHKGEHEFNIIGLYDLAHVAFYCSASKNGMRRLLRYLSARNLEIANIKVLPILSKAFK